MERLIFICKTVGGADITENTLVQSEYSGEKKNPAHVLSPKSERKSERMKSEKKLKSNTSEPTDGIFFFLVVLQIETLTFDLTNVTSIIRIRGK